MTRREVVLGSNPCPPLPPVYWKPALFAVKVGPTAPSGTGITVPFGWTTKSGLLREPGAEDGTAGVGGLKAFDGALTAAVPDGGPAALPAFTPRAAMSLAPTPAETPPMPALSATEPQSMGPPVAAWATRLPPAPMPAPRPTWVASPAPTPAAAEPTPPVTPPMTPFRATMRGLKLQV